MKSYKYVARDSSGAKKEGVIKAASSNDALGWLREQRFTPVCVDENVPDVNRRQPKVSRKQIKSGDLAAICWQLTTMVEGGIPITTALDTINEDIDNSGLQEILQQVSERMQKGETFSNSLAEFPRVFNRLACSMLRAGETGGNLPLALRRMAEYYDNRDKLARKVKGAMAYPVFVLTFIVLIVIFIMTFIIPRFRMIFDQIGGDLPAFTQVFMNFYDMMRYNIVYIIGGALLLGAAAVLCSKTRKGHYLFCKIALGLPLLGKVLRQAFVVMFCSTMSTLLAAGVSILEVLDILGTMTDNDIIRAAIQQSREHIVEGSSISTGLGASGFFPNMVVKMIQVGEESGALSRVLDRTSDYYERKVNSTIDTLMGLLEPIMIVSVGGIVLVVVLALYLPIFSMSKV